jgi:hypothetical protein
MWYIHNGILFSHVNGDRVSVWDDEKFGETDSGDGYNTLWMQWQPLYWIV